MTGFVAPMLRGANEDDGVAGADIEVPIEVLGAEGTVVQRTFELSAGEATRAQFLWMQINSLNYENKASVRINDGPWVSLNHNTVTMHHQELARGGMVRGGYGTVRVRIPTPDFVEGSNTVSFRFNMSDGISIGYRVVRFQLLDGDRHDILPSHRFREVDPNEWCAPDGYGNASDVAAGEALWRTASLWNHYLPEGRTGNWHAAEIPAAEPIRATCADCHTQDGRDLEIFSYSNESIVERSVFHHLEPHQGRQIAANIRSLSDRFATVGRYGRPWNPPYQPGPEVSQRPVHERAAGAGLDDVLASDSDMLREMIPGEVNAESVAAYFDSGAMEDHTTLRIAMQLPDWKSWLPIVHPMDAFANDGYYEDDSVEYRPTVEYERLRQYLDSRPVESRTATELLNALSRYHAHTRRFLSQGAPGPTEHWRTTNGSAFTRGLK